MKRLGVYVLLIILLSSFQTPKNPKSIPIKNHNQLYFVELKLNNKRGNFLIDTGAVTSLIDINQSNQYKFNFELTEHSFVGVGGLSHRYLIRNYSITHDSVKIYIQPNGADLKIVVNSFSKNGIDMVGILGSDFLDNHNAIINYKKKELTIYN